MAKKDRQAATNAAATSAAHHQTTGAAVGAALGQNTLGAAVGGTIGGGIGAVVGKALNEEPEIDEVATRDELDKVEPIAVDSYEEEILRILKPEHRTLRGAVLFAEACMAYGVNPYAEPIEVLTENLFKFYQGDNRVSPPVPDRIKFVTAGGQKVVHPMDQDWEEKLRNLLHAFHYDKNRARVDDPLPADLTLPREAVTGIPRKTDHVFKGGYLRQKALERAKSTSRL